MAAMSIEVKMPRRLAVAQVHELVAKRLGLPTPPDRTYGEYDCYVLGLLSEADESGSTPVFVCEFLNGRVGNIYTEKITFVNTEEGGPKE